MGSNVNESFKNIFKKVEHVFSLAGKVITPFTKNVAGLKRLIVVLGIIFIALLNSGLGQRDAYAENENNQPQEVQPYNQPEKLGDLDCGLTDVGCHITNYFANLAQGIINQAIKLLDNFAIDPSKIINDKEISGAYEGVKKLAWALVLLFFIYQLLRVLVMANEDPTETKRIVVKLILTTLIAGNLTTIFEYMLLFGKWSVEDITSSGVPLENFIPTESLSQYKDMLSTAMVLALVLLGLGICLILLGLQFLIRFGELIVAFILGPIAVMTNLNDEFNFFSAWLRFLVSLVVTQVIQILLLVLTIRISTAIKLSDFSNAMTTIALILVILKMPGIVQSFVYSSGVGRAAVGTTAGVFTTAVKHVIRKKIAG